LPKTYAVSCVVEVQRVHCLNHGAGKGGKGKKKSGKKKQKPAFSVMVHYHRFVDGNKGYGMLLLLKNKYLEKLMSRTRSELESLRGKSAEEQPRGWRLDINDGVRINIAPWERLGMFPVKKIVGEVEMSPE